MAKKKEDCLLLDPVEIRCKKSDCSTCGWNHKVEKARKREIEANGLTRGPDGVSCLIIKKEAGSNGSDT